MAERGSLDPMPAGSTNELGAFLRAHRARVEPADVGLPGGGDRRVAGLRREEVAVLAGVSVDYYARLEQGRERNPSAQVLDAIGRALELHADAPVPGFRFPPCPFPLGLRSFYPASAWLRRSGPAWPRLAPALARPSSGRLGLTGPGPRGGGGLAGPPDLDAKGPRGKLSTACTGVFRLGHGQVRLSEDRIPPGGIK